MECVKLYCWTILIYCRLNILNPNTFSTYTLLLQYVQYGFQICPFCTYTEGYKNVSTKSILASVKLYLNVSEKTRTSRMCTLLENIPTSRLCTEHSQKIFPLPGCVQNTLRKYFHFPSVYTLRKYSHFPSVCSTLLEIFPLPVCVQHTLRNIPTSRLCTEHS